MLEIRNLTKTYGDKKAVDNLSLHIKPGEICAFIGHNGAGKTTTLKSACGILRFDEGEILINCTSIKTDPVACKKQLAYIPDNPDMYEFMTGIKYLNFIADVFAVDKAERQYKIDKYAEMFALKDDLGGQIAGYSHGMKQKLALISALIHSPKLILMDEPFVGLDPVSTHMLKELMRRMCDEGAAIFFSTHVLDVAEKLCDHVAIIRKGQLVVEGTMESVRGDASLEQVFLELEEK
ncbi:MAG: ABC transporter ATP-binding protein [Oscillospiraceae bacterium]|nr:ABC transporter ATP-binding protein [Oscillospiraceae bacterium]